MKLSLISLDMNGGVPPLGLAYIASYLREYSKFDNTVIIDKEEPIKKIRKEKPDVVGISAVTGDVMKAIKLSRCIKQQFDIPTVIGGPHISMLPLSLPKSFDVGVVGEGEQTMSELVGGFERFGEFKVEELAKIDGIAFHNGSTIKITNPRSLIMPLDTIPYPARDLLKMKDYYLQPRNLPHMHGKITIGTHIIPGRGCPYRCKFCSNIWRGVRNFSAEYLIGEVKHLIEEYKIRNITFYDDLFIADKKRLEEFAILVEKEGIDEYVEFSSFGRTNLIDEQTCKTLNRMNLKSLSFGFESGSNRILQYLKGQSISISDHANAIRLCRKHGIRFSGTFMTGIPSETREDMERTFDFIKDNIGNNEGDIPIYILTPLPGTEIWSIAVEMGLVSNDMDWEKLNQIFVGKEQKVFFLPKNMTESEFYGKLSEMREYTFNKPQQYDIKPEYFLRPFIIKKCFRHPRMMFSYFCAIIRNAVRKKLKEEV